MLKEQNRNNLIVNNSLELLEDVSVEANGKGRKFVSRFIEAGLVHYEQFGDVLITKETLDKFIQSMVGCPVIITHKDITDKNADKERVGVISRVWFNPEDGWFYCEGVIWDKQAIDLVKNQGWSVSCTYDFKSNKQTGTYHGKKYDMKFTDGEFLHLALVDNPRYEGANIVMNSKDRWITIKNNADDRKEIVDWITVKGNHLPIRKGETKDEVVNRFIARKEQKSVQYQIEMYKGNLKRETEKLERLKQGNDTKAIKQKEEKIEYIKSKISEFEQQKRELHRSGWSNYDEDDLKKWLDMEKQFKNKAINGWVTLDETDEEGNRKRIFIEGYHAQSKEERIRKSKILENFKEGSETKYEYTHTRANVSDTQRKQIENIIKDVYSDYSGKPLAQLEVRSLGGGALGLCTSGKNASIVGLDSSLFSGKYTQEHWEQSVKDGFHPKTDNKDMLTSVLTHELGHAISVNVQNEQFWNEIEKSRKEYLSNVKKKDVKNPDFISDYARVNKYEFMAEAFAQGRLSKKYGKYTEQVMKSLDEYISKFKQLKIAAKNAQEDEDVIIWEEDFGAGYPINEEAYERAKSQQNKKQVNNNRKDLVMTALNDLETFVRGIVENACKKEEVKNDETDKRKLIDEVAGMLKSAGADDELIRTAIGKMEKLAYDKSETDKADNKCKNEDDKEEKEEKFEEEKEIADVKNKCKNEEEEKKDDKEDKKEVKDKVENSMDKIRQIAYGTKEQQTSDYVSRKERLELGNNY